MPARYFKIADSGHSWLSVPRHDVLTLGLMQEISPYSYQKGLRVYLEEDNDKWTFLNAYKAKHGDFPKISERHGNRNSDAQVRRYDPFVPDGDEETYRNA